ncbi:MAG: SufD family Fe-S cluster assembly protein [Candidatus Diapherotrites archaeon]
MKNTKLIEQQIQEQNEDYIKKYLEKNKEIIKETPLKKSKYTNITKLNEIIKTTKTGKAEININQKEKAEIIEINSIEELKNNPTKTLIKKTLNAESTPKDQYEAKANTAIEKATIIKLKETKEQIKIKIKTKNNTCNKVIIIIPKNSETTIITEYELEENSILAQTLICEENSKINHAQKIEAKKEAILTKQFILEKDTKLTNSELIFNGELFRTNTTIVLEQEGAETQYYSSLIGEKQNKHDINYIALHKGENTKSHFIFKSVAKDQSKNVFDGMIKITETGKKTNALLECHGMIIGNQASINQIPSLEISNDDVKATHSATIAHIQEDEIFYLQTRGLETEQAKKMIIKSFLESNTTILPENTKKEIVEEIEKRV